LKCEKEGERLVGNIMKLRIEREKKGEREE
jgi:hypothetical protein